MLQNIDTHEIIRVDKNDCRAHCKKWVNPRKLNPEVKYSCEYCGITTTPANLKRWHNDNCKQKESR